MKTKILKTYEVISKSGKSYYLSAFTEKDIKEFFLSAPIKNITKRPDINPLSCKIILNQKF